MGFFPAVSVPDSDLPLRDPRAGDEFPWGSVLLILVVVVLLTRG